MELRKLNDFEYQKLIDLCRACFGADTLFVSYDDFKTENSLGIFDGECLVSVLYFQDRMFVYNGNEYKSCIITNCATKNEYRNNGCMSKLLEIETELLGKRDYVFCFVNPPEHTFFRLRGWQSVSFCNRFDIDPVKDDSFDVTMFIDPERMQTLYDGYTIGRSHFSRNDSDFMTLINTVDADGGQVMLADDFYVLFSSGAFIEVFEHTCSNESQKKRMLNLLSGFGKRIRYSMPVSCNDENKEEKTMVKVINNVFDMDTESVIEEIRLSNPVVFNR